MWQPQMQQQMQQPGPPPQAPQSSSPPPSQEKALEPKPAGDAGGDSGYKVLCMAWCSSQGVCRKLHLGAEAIQTMHAPQLSAAWLRCDAALHALLSLELILMDCIVPVSSSHCRLRVASQALSSGPPACMTCMHTSAFLVTSCAMQVTSPMAGTFYRSPAPGEAVFVKEGDRVTSGQTVCIIEAMKLMNEIEVGL